MSHCYGTNRPLWTISRLQIGWKSSSLTLAPMDCNDAKRWWFFNGVYQLSWFRVSMVFSINLWINCMHTFLRNWGIYCAYIHKQSNWHNQFWCPTLLYVFVFYEFNGVDIICFLYIYTYYMVESCLCGESIYPKRIESSELRSPIGTIFAISSSRWIRRSLVEFYQMFCHVVVSRNIHCNIMQHVSS